MGIETEREREAEIYREKGCSDAAATRKQVGVARSSGLTGKAARQARRRLAHRYRSLASSRPKKLTA